MALVSWYLKKKKGRFLVLSFPVLYFKIELLKTVPFSTFVGGERNPELCTLPESEILKLAHKENQSFWESKENRPLNILNYGQKSIPVPDATMDARIKAASALSLENKGTPDPRFPYKWSTPSQLYGYLKTISLFD